jgi:tRNA (guanine-N7-)-methyltransferase
MAKGRRIARIPNIEPDDATRAKYLRHWRARDLWQHPESFPQLTGQGLFSQEKPLALDIGCGSGEFLVAEAAARPDELFVGVEASRRAAYYAVDQAQQRALDNILFVRADFKMLYPLMRPESLSGVYLLFPDPNYGAKYQKLRIFDGAFLDAMHAALRPDGIIQVVTDEEAFFMELLAMAEADPRFEKMHTERYLTDFKPRRKTRFQQAWERKEKPVYRLEISSKRG